MKQNCKIEIILYMRAFETMYVVYRRAYELRDHQCLYLRRSLRSCGRLESASRSGVWRDCSRLSRVVGALGCMLQTYKLRGTSYNENQGS